MNLWIRSQDKEVLTKVIDIYKQADTNEIWSYSDKGIKNCLGIYKSKERTLEVLDEIQNLFLFEINDASYERADLFLKMKMLPIVYKMPKE